MPLKKFADTLSIAAYQTGLAPRLRGRLELRRRARQFGAYWRRVRRRAALMLGACFGLSVILFWPPSHGAVLVVAGPWVSPAEIERRIQEAGGVALTAADGDVSVFGVRIARKAIGADPNFARAALGQGALVLDAGPVLWLESRFTSSPEL